MPILVLIFQLWTSSVSAVVLFSSDFETNGLDDFTQIDLAGGTNFSVSASGVSGNAGQVGGNVASSASGTQAGAWLQPTDVYADPNFDFTITADVQFLHEASSDDCVLVLGNFNTGNYYTIYLTENLPNNEVYYYSGANRNQPATVTGYTPNVFADNTWYTVTLSWTAATQTLNFNATLQDDPSSFASFSVVLNGSANNNPSLTTLDYGIEFGLGTHNDGARFDNISIDGTAGSEPSEPTSPSYAVQIAPDGAWTWFNDERAIVHQGYLFCGYVMSNGNYGISRFDPTTNTATQTVISTSSSRQRDDHNNPSITILPDNRLLILYARHGTQNQFYHRTSTVAAPASISDWGPEVSVNSTDRYTYNNTYRLTSESVNATHDRIYGFHREVNWDPTITYSDDSGATWSSPFHFIDAGGGSQRPYPKYWSNHEDRIDLIYTDGHPQQISSCSIYHLYYQSGAGIGSGAFYQTDGTLLKSLADITAGDPIDHDGDQSGATGIERGTFVYEYTSAAWNASTPEGPDEWIPGGLAWTWDICSLPNGNPVCAFQVQDTDVLNNHSGNNAYLDDRIYYYYAVWTGSVWQKRCIAQGGRPIYGASQGITAQRHYGGGMAIDPDNPNVVYIASNAADPTDLNFNSGGFINNNLSTNQRFQIYRGVTDDGGLTFTWEQLTADSNADNLRPIVPEGHGYDRTVLWFSGTYTTFLSFNTQVLGIMGNKLDVESYTNNGGNTINLTWRSSVGRTYQVEGSLDLQSFPHNAASDVESEGGSTSHTFPLPATMQGSDRGFFSS